MPLSLDKEIVDIRCPRCGHVTQQTIGWIKTHDNFVCVCVEP